MSDIPTYYNPPQPIPSNPPATVVEQLVQLRQNYLNALLVDSISPPPSHNINGVQVSAKEWRESLIKEIANINNLITAFSPTEIITIMQ
jgi:hypothetical protein